MSAKRPPAPRSSGGSSRASRPGGRSTRPASGQLPSSTGSSRTSAANRGTAAPRSASSPDHATSRRGAEQPAQDGGRRQSPPRNTAPDARAPKKPQPASPGRAGFTKERAQAQQNNSSGPSVSAYAVGAPLNRNFGLLHTTGARIVAVALTLAVCAVIVTPVLRNYFKQYNANNVIRAEIAKQQTFNDDLRNELDRWNDDKYVIAQARERLTFVFPGETPYRVMGWDPEDLAETTASAGTPALFPDQQKPWYEELFDSVKQTGDLISE